MMDRYFDDTTWCRNKGQRKFQGWLHDLREVKAPTPGFAAYIRTSTSDPPGASLQRASPVSLSRSANPPPGHPPPSLSAYAQSGPSSKRACSSTFQSLHFPANVQESASPSHLPRDVRPRATPPGGERGAQWEAAARQPAVLRRALSLSLSHAATKVPYLLKMFHLFNC
jgi:hypothetical protein